jgi:hypothetical protein
MQDRLGPTYKAACRAQRSSTLILQDAGALRNIVVLAVVATTRIVTRHLQEQRYGGLITHHMDTTQH